MGGVIGLLLVLRMMNLARRRKERRKAGRDVHNQDDLAFRGGM
jgi:hypothetical protein